MHDPPFGLSQTTSKYISSANKIVFLEEKQLNLMLLLKKQCLCCIIFYLFWSVFWSAFLKFPSSPQNTSKDRWSQYTSFFLGKWLSLPQNNLHCSLKIIPECTVLARHLDNKRYLRTWRKNRLFTLWNLVALEIKKNQLLWAFNFPELSEIWR